LFSLQVAALQEENERLKAEKKESEDALETLKRSKGKSDPRPAQLAKQMSALLKKGMKIVVPVCTFVHAVGHSC